MSKIYDALRKANRPEGEEPQPDIAPLSSAPPPEAAAGEAPPAGGTAAAPADEVHPEAAPAIPVARDEDLPPLTGAFAREMTHLRAAVEQSLPDFPQRTILVAGSVPGEGASTIAARFAQLLAEDVRLRVGLVDADLRNADPRTIETVAPGAGFASVLQGSLSMVDALQGTGLGGLEVLPSEGVNLDPYGLCTTRHVEPFLDYLRGQFHFAILDAAPVLSAPETATLGGAVDGVVLVVRAGKTKREVVRRALDRFRAQGARTLGVVMNRQQYVIPEFIYRRL